MGKLRLTDSVKKRISIAMMALAVLMLADTIYQTCVHVSWRGFLPATLGETPPATQPADTQPAAEGGRKPSKPPVIHGAIRKRNIFTQPKPKGHGMSLIGVLGDTALFQPRGGEPVGIKEGESSRGIKVTSINGYEVTIEYKGKTQTMRLFDEKGRLRPAPPGPTGGPSGGPRMVRPGRDRPAGEDAGDAAPMPTSARAAPGGAFPSTQGATSFELHGVESIEGGEIRVHSLEGGEITIETAGDGEVRIIRQPE